MSFSFEDFLESGLDTRLRHLQSKGQRCQTAPERQNEVSSQEVRNGKLDHLVVTPDFASVPNVLLHRCQQVSIGRL